MTQSSVCPLCLSHKFEESWAGACAFQNNVYTYLECADCKSSYCCPMPDLDTLAKMYGAEYSTINSDPGTRESDDPKDVQWVVDRIARLSGKLFIDYGCGGGKVLQLVKQSGWSVAGVEYDPIVALNTQKVTGCKVYTPDRIHPITGSVDVLYLGDVVEHLTDPAGTLTSILQLLKPDGILIAQGPLEAHLCLFTSLLKGYKKARGGGIIDMPPYHVLLATAKGQRSLFRQAGLTEIEFRVTEVDWPAPSRLHLSRFVNLRDAGLFLARRLSKLVSQFSGGRMGNRYFYVGQKGNQPALFNNN